VGEAYTYLQPCAGSRGLNGEQVVEVADVCVWGDGEHVVRGVAVDTGGREGRSSNGAVVKVDCTAPNASVGPATFRVVDPGAMIDPAPVATDAHAGVVATETQVRVDDGAWVGADGPIVAVADRMYRFRARATDAAGNVSAWSEPSAPVYVRGVDPPEEGGAPGWVSEPAQTQTHTQTTTAAPVRTPAAAPALALGALGPAPAPAIGGRAPRAKPRPERRLLLTTVRRTATNRVRVAGRLTNAPATKTVLVRVTAAGRTSKKRLRLKRGAFAGTLRSPHDDARRIRVEASTTTPDGRRLKATKTSR